jgi:hypothetical protein
MGVDGNGWDIVRQKARHSDYEFEWVYGVDDLPFVSFVGNGVNWMEQGGLV